MLAAPGLASELQIDLRGNGGASALDWADKQHKQTSDFGCNRLQNRQDGTKVSLHSEVRLF
jgi:hypothetical protein